MFFLLQNITTSFHELHETIVDIIIYILIHIIHELYMRQNHIIFIVFGIFQTKTQPYDMAGFCT